MQFHLLLYLSVYQQLEEYELFDEKSFLYADNAYGNRYQSNIDLTVQLHGSLTSLLFIVTYDCVVLNDIKELVVLYYDFYVLNNTPFNASKYLFADA